ncbi:receptor-like serine/threonine-protein kinase SD1-8 [Tanacetum coccineum]
MMSHKQSTHARRTYAPQHKVLTNDDLLTQILIRLPILSIHLFTTVSKQWLRILTSPDFTRNRRQIRNIDPPAGLFVNHITSSFHCVFVSLDTRIKSTKYTSDKSFTLGYTEAVVNVNILQSCNDYAHDDSNFYGCAGLRLAFDPTKSPDYKVVRAGRNSCEIVIQIYSSESGNWTLCRERFTYFLFVHFDSAIYWNDALHWLETENRRLTHYKLNIEDHEHPIITTIQISQDHEQPIITTMLPMIISIRIPHMLHLEGKLFESLGCLVLVRRDCIGSSKFTIYQMRKGCSVWSSKYIVNTDDFMNPLPEGWSIRSIVWSIVLGEREEDSFLIINLCAKVVKYNLISKTLHEIYDMGSNEIADDYLYGFIPLYAMYNVGYKNLDYKVFEFIPSSARV